MEPNEISELMRNYRAYRYAVQQYERHNPYPTAGVANYDAMPSGSGAPELFFDLVGKAADMGNTSVADAIDYQVYKSAVEVLDGALLLLTEEEYSIVRLKWMEDVELKDIPKRKHISDRTVSTLHRRALGKLNTALRFYRMPELEKVHCNRIQKHELHL